MSEGDKSKRVRRTSSYSNQKEKTYVAGNAEDGRRQDLEHNNTGSLLQRGKKMAVGQDQCVALVVLLMAKVAENKIKTGERVV